MLRGPDAQRNQARLLVWWVLWGSILAGLVVLYLVLVRGKPLPANLPDSTALTGLAGVVPLFVSIIIRWLVLPRYTEMARALALFIVGMALAEGCGIIGMFFGGPYRDELFVLGVLGVAQYMPFFARNYLEPKPREFIPNN